MNRYNVALVITTVYFGLMNGVNVLPNNIYKKYTRTYGKKQILFCELLINFRRVKNYFISLFLLNSGMLYIILI